MSWLQLLIKSRIAITASELSAGCWMHADPLHEKHMHLVKLTKKKTCFVEFRSYYLSFL